ncbi:MAG: hypothetical protein IT319_09435 [Anaerolineae bacterium]|nr:hypothetical protein [Anaerolineae bacterium]
MKIPFDAIIANEKLTDYLLVPRQRNDKSKYLAMAGFTTENPDALKQAIRALADTNEAAEDKATEYGTSYLVEGDLQGANDRRLPVVLVWFQRLADGRYYFVTLKPGKGVSSED